MLIVLPSRQLHRNHLRKDKERRVPHAYWVLALDLLDYVDLDKSSDRSVFERKRQITPLVIHYGPY